MGQLLRLLLLLQLLLVPALAFDFDVKDVLKAEDGGQIVSRQYWAKFSTFMAELDRAAPKNRTLLLNENAPEPLQATYDGWTLNELKTIPHIHEFLVPPELLAAISTHLSDADWLATLGDEYSRHGGHNMSLLIEVLTDLGELSARENVTVPEDVLEKLCWRGMVRRQQQDVLRQWVHRAVNTFFNCSEATELQRSDHNLFSDYIHNVFEHDWMTMERILADTLELHKLRAELKEEVSSVPPHEADSAFYPNIYDAEFDYAVDAWNDTAIANDDWALPSEALLTVSGLDPEPEPAAKPIQTPAITSNTKSVASSETKQQEHKSQAVADN